MSRVHSDISQASTLPTEFYTDPAVFARSRDGVFAKSWQFAGDLSSVKVPGQVNPHVLLEGCLDEPLLITRDSNDGLHCLSNVCTHRGSLVCEHPGNERSLRCRYHGRRFALDGKFQSMPEFEGVANFPTAADDLAAVPFGLWDPFLFACLAPSRPFPEWLQPMEELSQGFDMSRLVYDSSRSRDYLVNANWALYVENYLEGFHVPFVHPSLNEVVDYGSYTTETFDGGSVQIAYGDDAIPSLTYPFAVPKDKRGVAALYVWMFPNTMFNFYPWGVSVNVVKPLAHDRTRISFLCYVSDATRLGTGAGAELDRVEREDEAVVESVQRGVRSRFYQSGRYSPTREQGVHHFHRILEESLQL